MSFVAAVGAGGAAADHLEDRCTRRSPGGTTTVVRHQDLAVAYAAGCPWVETHDDGDVLAMVDGRLHDVGAEREGQAELVGRRYRTRGLDVARGLLGDFVLVILDRPNDRLLVARDPVGVRPWYQATAGRSHVGASDVATLAAVPWVDTTLDDAVAVQYLAALSQSRGATLHRGIRTLRPGETWYVHDGRARTFAHHRWDIAPDLDISWSDAAERCREALDTAVRCRLDVGGPPTSELSGGLDSSAIVGTIARLGRRDGLMVGRLVFDGPRADERAYSDAVLDHWQLAAVSAPPWMPTDEEADELTRELRRPPPDPHFTMFASLHRQLLDRGRADGLTGLGGDDAFAACSLGSRIVSAVKLRHGRVLGRLARDTRGHPRQVWTDMLRPTLHHLAPWRGDRLPAWVTSAAARRADLPRLFREPAARVTGIDALDERIANLTSGYDAAILEDRAIVADWTGRRDAHPMLDPRFVRVTYGLDPSWPTRHGHTRALQVAAFADRLPPLVAERRSKADFSEVFWPALRQDALLGRVRTGPLVSQGWLDLDGFDGLVAHAKEGKANAAIPLSRCVSLDRWMRLQ
jgi:asparagine synthase (glutamine-hydrolysing)